MDTPHAKESEARACRACGARIEPGDRFCTACGSQAAGEGGAPAERGTRRNAGVIALAVAVLLAVALVFTIGRLLGRGPAQGTADKRGSALAARQSAEESLGAAERAFQTEERPAAFARGKKALAEGDAALEQAQDSGAARKLFDEAREAFSDALSQAEEFNAQGKAKSDAIAARDALLAVRKQVGPLAPVAPAAGSPRPRPGSLSDVLARARLADAEAGKAMDRSDYPRAQALCENAEKLYRAALALLAKRGNALAAMKGAEEGLKAAEARFKTDARPPALARGKQAIAEGERALNADEDFEAAKGHFDQARVILTEALARAQTDDAKALAKARADWASALASPESEIVAKGAAAELAAAKQKAARAEAKAAAGDARAAAGLFAEAAQDLRRESTGAMGRPAVESGLAWLAAKQLTTGAWRADRDEARWADPGITGLAVLAFLRAGYSHEHGKYRETVRHGLVYLKEVQDFEGCFAFRANNGGKGKPVGGYMYCHGIATLAFAESYRRTKDPRFRERTERAVDFICKTQNPTGGWRYYANSSDADASVGGWMVTALHVASAAGLDVPQNVFDGARRFFNSVTDRDTGATSYMPGLLPSSAALLAIGLLCHQYLGMKADDPYLELASAAILKFPPKWVNVTRGNMMAQENLPRTDPGANDYYFWYYATHALAERGGEPWEKWRPLVRDMLLQHQVKEGPDTGSWPPDDRWSLRGGRVYATAMAILCLTVHLRDLPRAGK